MKSLWNSFKIAFAMFSKIPMPQADWSEENMRYMLCFFPFVGAAVGVVMLGMEWLCRYFGMSNGFIAVMRLSISASKSSGRSLGAMRQSMPSRRSDVRNWL